MTRTLCALFVLTLSAAPARAHTAADRWLPFLGCWQSASRQVPGTGERLCLVPAGEGVEFLSVTDDATETLETLVANGQARRIDVLSCAGTERAEWSEDGGMVFMSGTLQCDGRRQSVSRLLGFAGAPGWVDIQVLSEGGATVVRTRKYQRVNVPASLADRLTAELVVRAAGAAQDASRRILTVKNIIEATTHAPSEGVEALLFETRTRFLMSRSDLVALEQARVGERVIDLMIAISYPEHFAVSRPIAAGPLFEPSLYDVQHAYPFHVFDPYMLLRRDGTPLVNCTFLTYACYDYYPGSQLTYYPQRRPPEALTSDGVAGNRAHGSVEKGRGYSNGSPAASGDSAPAATASSGDPSSSGSSSSAAASGSGQSSGTAGAGYSAGPSSSDTGRTAVPR